MHGRHEFRGRDKTTIPVPADILINLKSPGSFSGFGYFLNALPGNMR